MSPSKKLSEAYGDSFSTTYTNAHDLILGTSTKFSSRTALVCMHQSSLFLQSITQSSPSPYLRWTFAELSRASHAFAQTLAAADVRPGMRIATLLSNGAEVWVSFLASLELNCTFAPLNPKMTANAEETKHVFGILEPAVILAQDATITQKLESYVPTFTKKALVKLLAADIQVDHKASPQEWQGFSNFVEDTASCNALAELEINRKEEDAIVVFFTSGTTSLPKGCPHTNKTFLAHTLSWGRIRDFDETRSECLHMPQFHIFAFLRGFMPYFWGLKTVHPAGTFEPGSTLKAIHLERCSDMACVPAIIHAILAHPEMKSTDTSCLKHVLIGAATVLPQTIQSCIEDLGSLKVSDGFGMTECGSAIFHRYNDLPNHAPGRITSGSPTPGTIIRICDPVTRQIVGVGEPGELHVGGPGVIESYW
jgi:acyl-CoA synthetase (AMP-forming)/AMP-acid ligase II